MANYSQEKTTVKWLFLYMTISKCFLNMCNNTAASHFDIIIRISAQSGTLLDIRFPKMSPHWSVTSIPVPATRIRSWVYFVGGRVRRPFDIVYFLFQHSPAQCSINSSVSGIVKSFLWSKRNVTSDWWRGDAGGAGCAGGGVSALTTGGTTTGSPGPEPPNTEYWQNTKWDSDGGRPVACFIATRIVTWGERVCCYKCFFFFKFLFRSER